MATTEKLALIDNSGVSTTDLLINTGTPTFEGKAEPQTSVELFDNDDSGGSTSLGTETADANGDWSFTVAAGSELADGTYSITVSSVPAGESTATTSAALEITIDTTDPAFTSGSTATALNEKTGAEQVVYTASSNDDSTVSYSLKSGIADDADHFTIDSSTGEVKLSDDPDYAAHKSYSFTVVATDDGGNSSEQAVTLDINDKTAPSITSSTTAAAINENSGVNQVVYKATSSDESSVTYSLLASNGDDADHFTINSSTGDVTLSDNPDYENQNSYSFTVVAQDSAGNSSQQDVTLAINNVEEIAQLGSDLVGEAAGDEFGLNTALSADGAILAVGGRKHDGNGNNAGHVRIYR